MKNPEKKFIVSAPGRICLMGEHQDYYGLSSITAAINLRIDISVKPRNDSILSIALPDINEQDHINLEKSIEYLKQQDYLRSGIVVMRRRGVKLSSGFNIEIKSQIPIAKGISSSSALSVAWIQFLIQAAGKPEFSPHQIADLAYNAEVVEFAEAGGMMDQFSSAIGGIMHIDCKEPYTVTKLNYPVTGFLLGDSLMTKDTQGVLSTLKNQVLGTIDELKSFIPDSSSTALTSFSFPGA